MNISKEYIQAIIKNRKRKPKEPHYQARIPGIAIDRDRPTHSGHCGAEKCSHASHAGHA